MLRRAFVLSLFAFVSLVPARADDAAEFQRIIADQIAAFNADDGLRAYEHAAPMIKQMFPTVEGFMRMVQNGYTPVYRQKSFAFEPAAPEDAGRPTQRVTIVDMNGKTWTAVYSFERQPDGTWRISGCALVEAPGENA